MAATATGTVDDAPVRHVFMMTGADPNTGWLDGLRRARRARASSRPGPDLAAGRARGGAVAARAPAATCSRRAVPGVFAVGDVRAGSVKRVASAVGEGSVCVQLVHKVLAE